MRRNETECDTESGSELPKGFESETLAGQGDTPDDWPWLRFDPPWLHQRKRLLSRGYVLGSTAFVAVMSQE